MARLIWIVPALVLFVALIGHGAATRNAARHSWRVEQARTEDMREAEMRQAARFAASDAIVDRLVAGETALATAVHDLQTLDLRLPWGHFYYAFREHRATESEVLAYYALQKARRRTAESGRPDRAEALARIEAQYAALFGHAPGQLCEPLRPRRETDSPH